MKFTSIFTVAILLGSALAKAELDQLALYKNHLLVGDSMMSKMTENELSQVRQMLEEKAQSIKAAPIEKQVKSTVEIDALRLKAQRPSIAQRSQRKQAFIMFREERQTLLKEALAKVDTARKSGDAYPI